MINIINDNFNDLAQDYYKLQEDYEKQSKENERLNKIISELEKELNRGYRALYSHELVLGRELITNILNYLQELKENKQ